MTLYQYLCSFAPETKLNLFNQKINERTRHLTVVLENLYQPHNASAVLRSCDCFGVQDVHIIEGKNKYKVEPEIAMGASKWLNTYKYPNSATSAKNCFDRLREKGYKIVATVPHLQAQSLYDFSVNEKTALVFGTEKTGLSDEAIAQADEFVTIPMYGFTESFNISVAVSICLYEMVKKMRESAVYWQLNEQEQSEIMLEWVKRTVKKSKLLEQEYEKLYL